MAWLALATGLAAPACVLAANVVGVRFGGDSATTRVVIDLDGPANFALDRSGQNRLDLDVKSPFDAGLQGGRGRGLVNAWSVAAGPLGERLRFDLAGDARVVRRFMIPPSEGAPGYRYVIDLAPDTPKVVPIAALSAVRSPTQVLVAPPAYDIPAYIEPTRVTRTFVSNSAALGRTPDPAPARADRRQKVIVIDAGHGGHDSGALGADEAEKDLTLAAARALKTRLERSGRYRVVLTRDTDVFIPLETRVKIARDGGADLFLSLHADSAGGDTATHGASVYTLSDSGGGRVRYVLGRNEWFAKVANRADAGTSQILLDLTQRSTRNRSATFAELLLDRLAGRVDLLPRGHRDAGYFVLLAPDVPAALLEMGFITNPEDEHRLADPAQRAQMMDAVAEAIDAYFTEGRKVAAE